MALTVDVRLCSDNTCLTSLADFTASDGICQSGSPTSSTLLFLGADARSAHLTAYSDADCATPSTLDMELVLDGSTRFAAPLWYTAAVTQDCLPPDPQIPYYSTMTGASGHQPGDVGNLDLCLFNGFQHCSIQDKTSGLFSGACLPRNCGVADVTNATSPIWQHILVTVPVWAAVLPTANLVAYCGTQAFPVDDGAAKTLAALAVAATAVLIATLYTLAVRAPRKGAEVAAPNAANRLPPALDTLLRAASLSTTLPRLFGAAPPSRARDEAAPRLAAFDGVRVLSLSLVVLGHSFFFPFSLTGYSNGLGVYDNLGKAAFMVIPSAEFAVDSFFALSGALGAYLFSKGLRKAFASAAAAEGLGAARAASGDASLNAALLEGDEGTEEDDESPAARRGRPLAFVRAAARGVAATAGAWAYATVHRYLRLVPSVGVMIAVFTYVAPLLGDGPYWRNGWHGSIDACNDHAWADLTFLNNFFPANSPAMHNHIFNDQCAGWLWYLAVDFQLHFIAIAPLCALFAAFAPAGWFALLGSLVGTIALSALAITSHSLTFLSISSSATLTGDSSDDFYDKPVERAPAFLVGVGLGWALLAWETRGAAAAAKRRADGGDGNAASAMAADDDSTDADFTAAALRVVRAALPMRSDGRAPDAIACAGLAASLTLLGVLFYTPTSAYRGELGQIVLTSTSAPAYKGAAQWSVADQQAYMAYSRPLWALGLCVMLYFCATRRGGVLELALGSPFWKPVATLAFGAYLYHPVVLYVLNLSAGASPRFSASFLATTYAATAVYAVLAAGVAYVLVEAPAAALEKLLVDGSLTTLSDALCARRAARDDTIPFPIKRFGALSSS